MPFGKGLASVVYKDTLRRRKKRARYAPKRRAKKAANRFHAKNTAMLRVTDPMQMIPKVAYVVFRQRYAINALSAGAISQAQYTIKGNSLYQPFGALAASASLSVGSGYATTDTPAGTGIYVGNAGLYALSRVYKSQLTVKTPGVLGSGTEALKICIAVTNPNQSAYSNYKQIAQTQFAKEYKDYVGIYKPVHLTNGITTSQAIGVSSKTVMTDQDFVGSNLVDPTSPNQVQYLVSWATGTGNNIGANIPIEFELIQWARLETPNMDNIV